METPSKTASILTAEGMLSVELASWKNYTKIYCHIFIEMTELKINVLHTGWKRVNKKKDSQVFSQSLAELIKFSSDLYLNVEM